MNLALRKSYSRHLLTFEVNGKPHQMVYISSFKEVENQLFAIILFSSYLRVQYKATQRLKYENELGEKGEVSYKGKKLKLVSTTRTGSANQINLFEQGFRVSKVK